jgi:spermidine/putrescine transport system substrate-binding protein
MRKGIWMVGLGALLIAAPVLGQDRPMIDGIDWTCPEGYEGQTLSIYNWSAYIAENTVGDFETLCGVTVTYDVYVSNEDMLARLRQGNPGFDIVVPTGYMIEIMIANDLLVPIDHDNIPNLANVNPELLDPPYDPDNVYTTPYQWGTIGIAYNQVRVGGEITRYEELFTYDGPVAWLEDARAMPGIALNQLGLDPNSIDADEIAQARDFLIENGDNVVTIVAADSQNLLQSGTVHMAIDYPGNTFQLRAVCECDDYVYVIPEEGTFIWQDNVAIPVDAPNPELAQVFMDYLLDPQVSADISNYTAYGTSNQVAIDEGLIFEEYLNNPGIYPPQELIERLFYVETVPEAETLYNDAWDEIKVALGQ